MTSGGITPAAVTALAVLLLHAEVRAQPQAPQPPAPDEPQASPGRVPPRPHFGGSLGFFFKKFDDGEKDLFFSPLLRLRSQPREHLAVDVDWGLTFGSFRDVSPGENETGTFPGNPAVAAHYVRDFGPMQVRAGGGVALPLSAAVGDECGFGGGDACAAILTGVTSFAMHGGWDLWLWAQEYFSMLATADIRGVTEMDVYLALDLGIGALVPVDSRERLSPESVMQIAGEIGYRAGVVIPGLRLQGVGVPTGADELGQSDSFQAALSVFVRGDLESGFVRAELLMNLDDPFGFAFGEDEGVYGVYLGGGVDI